MTDIEYVSPSNFIASEWGKPGRKPGWKPPPGTKSGFKKGVPREYMLPPVRFRPELNEAILIPLNIFSPLGPAHWKKSGRKSGQQSRPDANKPGPKPGVYVGPNRPPHWKKAGRKSRAEQLRGSEPPTIGATHDSQPSHGSPEQHPEPRPLVVSTWPVPASVNHGDSSFVDRGLTEGVQKVLTFEDLMSPGPVSNVVQPAVDMLTPVLAEPSSSTAVPNEVVEHVGNERTEPVGQSALAEPAAAQPRRGKGRPKGTKNSAGSKKPG